MKRKICVITGSRAEYGLLKPLLEEINTDSSLELQLIVTGMHLSKGFGLTYRQIEQDGFCINEKIDISLSSDTPVGITHSMGCAIREFAKAYECVKPDIIVVLGDRFEIFGAAVAAVVSRIPIAHINGGEVTEGAFDDSFRHSITKMSQLHFTSTETYRKRVIQLGESPQRVFNVGALNIDAMRRIKLLSRRALEKELGFSFNKRNLLVTFHPVTLEDDSLQGNFQCLLEVLKTIEDTQIVFTKANADTGGRCINRMIDEYVAAHKDKSAAFISLGQRRYFSLMRLVDGVIGNSSSGIAEAPFFKVGTINIGDRQKGRIRTQSIIDCSPSKEGIIEALKTLYSQEFIKKLQSVDNSYGDGNAASRIKVILKNYNSPINLKKPFYDFKETVKQQSR